MARIHEAVKKGSLHDLRLCLAKGDNFYALDDEGNTPLEIAKKRRNIEITKFLVIKHAVDEKYIEANEDEDKQTIINKLITTLLYKSNRHGWNSVVCVMLQYYICSLDSNFSNYTKEQYNRYISVRETTSGDFFGSYLSDDSDSGEEENYKRFDEDSKKEQNKKATIYQTRGQIGEIFLKRKSNMKKAGDLKNIDVPSSVFDLSKRATIYYDRQESEVIRDLNHLNFLLKRGETLENAQKEIKTNFFIAQYRGITYLTSKWNKPSRILHRKDHECGDPQYSAAVHKAINVNLYRDYRQAKQYIEEHKKEIKEKAEILREILLTLREPRPCTYEGYSYLNIAYMLQNIYTQNYDEFHRLINTDVFFREIFFNNANPFLSTGDTPYHALKYAYGIKPYKGHEGERLRPRWKRNGKAERPYSGVVYVSIHPLTDYNDDGPLHLVSLNRDAEIKLKDELNVIAEKESCFPAYLQEDRVVYKHVAKYPSFKEVYKNIHNYKYGITRAFYAKLREKFLSSAPHSKEMTEFKKILGEWLCSYYEVRLIDEAKKAAERKQGKLIYRDINGFFSLVPPIDSVNRNTVSITEEIKKPIKEKQEARQLLSPTKEKHMKLITDEESVEVITKKIYLLKLQDEESGILSEGNSTLSVEFSMLLNAARERRYFAFQEYISKPSFLRRINDTLDTYRLKDATLMHLAVLKRDVRLLNLLLSCSQVNCNQICSETTNEAFHGCRYYETISPLALAIIDSSEEIVAVLLQSKRINLKDSISYVDNKDLINDRIDTDEESEKYLDEHYLGLGWSCREAWPILRVTHNSLLHLAVLQGNITIVTALITAGVPLDTVNSDGYTAIRIALSERKIDIAAMLINSGCSLSSFELKEFSEIISMFDTHRAVNESKKSLRQSDVRSKESCHDVTEIDRDINSIQALANSNGATIFTKRDTDRHKQHTRELDIPLQPKKEVSTSMMWQSGLNGDNFLVSSTSSIHPKSRENFTSAFFSPPRTEPVITIEANVPVIGAQNDEIQLDTHLGISRNRYNGLVQYTFAMSGLRESLPENKKRELDVAVQTAHRHHRGDTIANGVVIKLILENEAVARNLLRDIGGILDLAPNELYLPGDANVINGSSPTI